jgi:hypothetical protein
VPIIASIVDFLSFYFQLNRKNNMPSCNAGYKFSLIQFQKWDDFPGVDMIGVLKCRQSS